MNTQVAESSSSKKVRPEMPVARRISKRLAGTEPEPVMPLPPRRRAAGVTIFQPRAEQPVAAAAIHPPAAAIHPPAAAIHPPAVVYHPRGYDEFDLGDFWDEPILQEPIIDLPALPAEGSLYRIWKKTT